MTDSVNNPVHYTQGEVECIDAIRSALTEAEFRGYVKGNVLKYIWRERHKGQDESLQKAQWYLNQITQSPVERLAFIARRGTSPVETVPPLPLHEEHWHQLYAAARKQEMGT
jgi:hypothetical protein